MEAIGQEVRVVADVRDVAHFFINIAQHQSETESGDLMTNLRLQKLLYFAQGWYLARFGKPLFATAFVAWKYGPVAPEIYNLYKKYGSQGITDKSNDSFDKFTADEYDLLLDVAREYDKYSTSALVSLSHAPSAPWSNAEQSAVIPQNEIQAYFAGKEPLLSFDDLLAVYPTEVI
jgi:uncharacterized phage-associated protein